MRIPFLLTFSLTYFLVFQWLPIGSLGKKAALWLILGTPGIWWIDLQIDGVKKGYGNYLSVWNRILTVLARSLSTLQRASLVPEPSSPLP